MAAELLRQEMRFWEVLGTCRTLALSRSCEDFDHDARTRVGAKTTNIDFMESPPEILEVSEKVLGLWKWATPWPECGFGR